MGKLIRGISNDGAAVCCVLDGTDLVYEAEQIHKTSAVATAALGRLLIGASMMGSMLKGEGDSITLRIAGKGPIGSVTAISDSLGNVKGYVANPIVEIPLSEKGKLDVGGAVGTDGFLSVIKDVGLPEPQTGLTPIVSGEIGEDLTYYFARSEQVPTVCALGVLVNTDLTVLSAGGYLIQLLPGAGEDAIEKIEKNVAALPAVSSMFHEGLTIREVMDRAMHGFEMEIMEEREVAYRCDCSKERVERALLSLGREELEKLASEQEKTSVSCQFCNKVYDYDKNQILSLSQRKKLQ